MVEVAVQSKPMEPRQNESVADYMQRLYDTTLGQASSIMEALKADPVNFTRLVNNIPNLIEQARRQPGQN